MYVYRKQTKGFKYKYGNIFTDFEKRKMIMYNLSGWSDINPIDEHGNYKSITTLLLEIQEEIETMAKSYKNDKEGM